MRENGLPKGEVGIVVISDGREPRYYISTNRERNQYYIYAIEGGGLKKLGKADSPDKLEEKYAKL